MRVKSPAAIKHRTLLKRAKGFKQSRHIRIKVANEAVMHAGHYAYVGRKDKKGDFRALWILRISASLKPFKISYSKFMNLLKTKNVKLDRKMLAELAVNQKQIFEKVVSFTTSK